MSLSTDQLDFDLNPELVARRPAEPRDEARMMVVDLKSDRVEHRLVRDLGEYLRRGDQLVLNDTRVIPARFKCFRQDTGGHLEGLLLEAAGERSWWAMLRKSRRLQPGHRLEVCDHEGAASGEFMLVEDVREGRIKLTLEGSDSPEEFIDRLGLVPTPPYIRNARRDAGEPREDSRDREWYQTVYASEDGVTRSVAAPTAGLHFTEPLLKDLSSQGVGVLRVALEVGAGTFAPVETATLAEHPMHTERCVVDAALVKHLQNPGKGRVIPVGTTSVRTLESLPLELPEPESMSGALDFQTNLLIEPGYQFRFLDGLLTNFHLPRSTLLALVAAVTGLDRLHALYREAMEHKYRFFSYGDAMLVLGCDGENNRA
jgi:S-adenosylmethionine:tRNA ribosyltransferase-isomerase